MKGICDILNSFPKQIECDVNYVKPAVDKLWLRKKKNGQIQIKINGEGKWIDAEYNEERKTLQYYI